MENKKVKNHIIISIITLVVGYFLASYVIGSFDHTVVGSDDRTVSLILIILATSIANLLYHESYAEKSNDDNDLSNLINQFIRKKLNLEDKNENKN
jgi:hypothetical protein